MARKVRQYSTAFTPSPRQKRRTLTIGDIPADLQRAYQSRAKREGVSIRSLVLTFLQDWSTTETTTTNNTNNETTN